MFILLVTIGAALWFFGITSAFLGIGSGTEIGLIIIGAVLMGAAVWFAPDTIEDLSNEE